MAHLKKKTFASKCRFFSFGIAKEDLFCKKKYYMYYTTDLLFYWLGLNKTSNYADYFNVKKLLNRKKRSVIKWYFPLQSNWEIFGPKQTLHITKDCMIVYIEEPKEIFVFFKIFYEIPGISFFKKLSPFHVRHASERYELEYLSSL